MVSPLEIAQESIALLEKAAQEADAFEAQVGVLQAENRELKNKYDLLSKQASAPKLDRGLLLKFATILQNEGMLADGMDAEKLASLYEQNPNRLADIALRLLCPVAADGQPIAKSAAIKESPGSPKTVVFQGREVIDHDGWLSAL